MEDDCLEILVHTGSLSLNLDVMTSKNMLRRYTDLPSLIDILSNKHITILDPSKWDDQNDSYYISIYKARKQLASVLALCLTRADETYHHWRVFSHHPAGACIVFHKEKLLEALQKDPCIRTKDVDYSTIKKNDPKGGLVTELPFLKRYAFKPEQEFRIIYQHSVEEKTAHSVDIPLSCIARISLSPWMAKSVAASTVSLLKKIDGCLEIAINRSVLINSEQWKNIGDGFI